MPREILGYRDSLEDILRVFDGRRLLSMKDVREYLGIADNRTVKRRFPFVDGYISATVLARLLAGGGRK